MTLQNAMDDIKNIMHFISVYSLLWVCVYVCVCVWCVCVCVQGRPVCVKWNGGGCLFSVTVRRVEGGERRGRERQTTGAEMCSHCDLNQMETTALPNRVLQIHRYTESVLRQNTADPSTFTTLSDQEKLAYLLGEHKTCCVLLLNMCLSVTTKRRHSTERRERERRETCCVFVSQYVSLCHHRREDTPSALSWCFQHM